MLCKVFGDEQGGFGNQMARAFPVQDLPGQMSIAYSTGRSSPKVRICKINEYYSLLVRGQFINDMSLNFGCLDWFIR